MPACDWVNYKTPLRTIPEFPALDGEGRSAHTFRRYVVTRRLPSIDLAPDVVRIRALIFQQALPYV